MSNLIHTLSEIRRATDWQMVGASCLGLDLLLFAALATYWEEAGRRRLRLPSRVFHRRKK